MATWFVKAVHAIPIVALGWVAGCGEIDRSLEWILQLDGDVSNVAVLEVSIRVGPCAGGGPPRHSEEYDVTSTPRSPDVLPPGEYAFEAVAVSSSCVPVARGCVPRVLPDDRTHLVVPLTAVVEPARCPAPSCSMGRCIMSDAGNDGGLPDAETPEDAGPSCDDGLRNGDETGVDCGGSCAPCPIVCTASPCVTAGLVAHYPFDGSILDASGNGNHLTGLDGNPGYQPGVEGMSAMLDGGGGEALIVDGSRPVLDVFRSGAFSIAGWMQHPDITDQARFLWSFDGDADLDLFYVGQKRGNVLQLRNGTSGGGRDNLEINIPATSPDTWHHIASTFDGAGNWVLYVDGCPFDDTGPMPVGTSLAGGECFMIGGEQGAACIVGSNAETWLGLVDEISVFDRALRPDEVSGAASLQAGTISSCD